jgi:hypothetical protein
LGEEKLLRFLAVVSALRASAFRISWEWREGAFAAAFLEAGGGREERKGGGLVERFWTGLGGLRGRFLLDMRFSAAFFFVVVFSLFHCSLGTGCHS